MPFDGVNTQAYYLAVLREARRRLKQPRAWRKLVMGNDGDPIHCALGWLAQASGVWHPAELEKLARATLLPALPDGWVLPFHAMDRPIAVIAGFNDWHGTRKHHVVALFDRAIELLEHAFV